MSQFPNSQRSQGNRATTSPQIEYSSVNDTEEVSESLGEVTGFSDNLNCRDTNLPQFPILKRLTDIYSNEPHSEGSPVKGFRHPTAYESSRNNSYVVIHPGIKTEGPSLHFGSMNDETHRLNKYLSSPFEHHENKGFHKLSSDQRSYNTASSKELYSRPSSTMKDRDHRLYSANSGHAKEESKELKETEGDNSDENDGEKQEHLIARLKNLVSGEQNVKFGWDIFIKGAAKARITSAFVHAKDNVVFDANNRELEIIGDKVYIENENKLKRRSFRSKREDAPKLRKILERHGIISKKNLEKKALKRVLNKVTRRKSKMGYMKGWVHSFKREVKHKVEFLKFMRENIILHPKGRIRLVWDIIALVLIFYDLFYVPFTLGFELEPAGFLFVFDVIKDMFFIFDVLLNCVTSYYDKNGNLIQVPKLIMANYIKTKWFLVDVLTALPVPLIIDLVVDEESSNKRFMQFFRFIRFLRLIRVIKALKLLRIYSKVEEFFYSPFFNGIKSIFSLLFYIILFAHWIACLWHFVGKLGYDDSGETWMTAYQIITQSTPERYVASLYFAIMTMITVGYGDIAPVTMGERIVSIIAMLSGCGMFAYSMNSIGILVQNLNARSSKTRQLYHSVNKYMEDKNVSKSLRKKVTQYLDYMAETQKQDKLAEESIFSSLSENLQNELKKDINGQVLRESLLFQSTFGSTFRNALSYSLVQQTLSPGEIIFEENDKSQSMYFISAGAVEIFISKSNIVISTLEKDTHFGEYSFFTGKTRTAAARSQNFSNIFHIKKVDFMRIIEDYPYEKEMFHMIKDQLNILNDYKRLKMRCYICNQEGHYAKYCFRVHYVPEKQNILDDHFKETRGFQKDFKRSKRAKFHALTGRKVLMTRLRDLLIDHPEEMKKHLQSDLFKSNSFIPPKEPEKNFLEMPKVNRERRRSRTLTGLVLAPENMVQGLPDHHGLDLSEERNLFVSQQKNKAIQNLIQGSSQGRLKTSRPENESESESEESKSSNKSLQSLNKLYIPVPQDNEPKAYTFDFVGSIPDEAAVNKTVLMRTTTLRQILDVQHEYFAMDMVTNYQVYFPHNNSKKIIDAINQPNKHKRQATKIYSPSPQQKTKLAEIFSRSKTDQHNKKLRKQGSSSSPVHAQGKDRGKSVFVMSRYSLWGSKGKLRRKQTGANEQPNISPFGLAASRNQALAGIVPHALAMSMAASQKKRRLSKSLGNLDSPMLQEKMKDAYDEENSLGNKDSEEPYSAKLALQEDSPYLPPKSGKNMRRGLSLAANIFRKKGRQDTWGANSSFNSNVGSEKL